MTREEAIKIIDCYDIGFYDLSGEKIPANKLADAFDMAIEALSTEPIERISDNTIVVKYADYEDIGRIILTNEDIFCKIFYEDARQNDDSDYDSLVPDEYKTEPNCKKCAIKELWEETEKEDLVAVVRCRDCRYRNGKVNRKGFEVCDATGMDITDDDYCSFGERREK